MENKENELCLQGDNAEVLLKTDAFTLTVNQLVDASFQTFANSEPADSEGRERSYAHYRALVDIVSTLQQRVTIRDEILSKEEADNNNQEEQSGP
jgi:hypothetical protein